MSAYLSVNNIEVIYDHVILVLKGVSLEVPKGKIVALLGANGAGQSTTLKAVSNLLRTERGDVTKGSIEFDGKRTDKLTMQRTGNITTPFTYAGLHKMIIRLSIKIAVDAKGDYAL